MHKFFKRRVSKIPRRVLLSRVRNQVRTMAESGEFNRHEIAISIGLRYEDVCELTKDIDMSSKKLRAIEFGKRRWLQATLDQKTAEDEERLLNRKDFHPTDAPSGTSSKIEVLRKRLESGQPLWHPDDRVDYRGLSCVGLRGGDDAPT
jgi:hypothetical protein